MQWWIPDFEKAGLRIVALTTDPPARNLRVVERFGLSIPILSDPQRRIISRFGMWNTRLDMPSDGFYLLDHDLKVLARHKGPWKANDEAKAFFLEMAAGKGRKAR